jgi:hypothetical protein
MPSNTEERKGVFVSRTIRAGLPASRASRWNFVRALGFFGRMFLILLGVAALGANLIEAKEIGVHRRSRAKSQSVFHTVKATGATSHTGKFKITARGGISPHGVRIKAFRIQTNVLAKGPSPAKRYGFVEERRGKTALSRKRGNGAKGQGTRDELKALPLRKL